jgi:transposase
MNGAINVDTLRAEVRFNETIDSASTISLFQQLEQANPEAPRIIVICDNARYDRSKAMAAYPTTSRIQLEPLPPYCPNLILIARFWKFFKHQVIYSRYYETFEQFRAPCCAFFRGLGAFDPQRHTLLTESFQIIGKQKPKACIA